MGDSPFSLKKAKSLNKPEKGTVVLRTTACRVWVWWVLLVLSEW